VLLALFVWSGIRIDGNSAYQRPDWRGVAALLGSAHGTRAIVAYDGTYATAPLALYLPGVKWSGSGEDPDSDPGAPVTVTEVDVVGNTAQRVARGLPAGFRLISSRTLDGNLVARFALSHPLTQSAYQLSALAPRLVAPAGSGKVLIQTRG
jgi:hypothetical protein